MKIGYLASPTPYGIFSVYRNLRPGLAPRGHELRWIGIGIWGAAGARNLTENERSWGEVVDPQSQDMDHLGQALVRHIIEKKYDAVFINPPQQACELNVARYLPPSMLRIMSVQMMGDGTYRYCVPIRDYVHATVGLSPRIRDDLVRRYEFDPKRTSAAAGIDLSPYQNLPPRKPAPRLRLIYFGRIYDGQKGVFTLASIMQKLAAEAVELRIAGDGPDMAELKRRCADLADRVEFIGVVPPANIPALLAEHDVFVFPTRVEGLGYVLLEAMAAGCVPVCSRIRGVTDYLVNDGKTGFLFPVDDAATAARHIGALARDRELLARISAAAAAETRQRFDALVIGKHYADLIDKIAADPPPIKPPQSMEHWSYPPEFAGQWWRKYVPEKMKNVFRAWVASR